MKKIRGIVFRVQNPQALASWYKEVLGFQTHQDSNGFVCEYPGNGARIKLVLGSGVMEQRGKDHVYWKIGLAMPDVDLGRKRILIGIRIPMIKISSLFSLNDFPST